MKTNTEISLRRHIAAVKIAAISLIAAALFIAGSPAARAASETWTPAAAGTYFWTNTADWSGSAAPGATGSTTNTDTATFGTLTGAEIVTVDSGRNVQNIVITDNATSAAYAYTFSGGPLILTADGSILSNATGTTVTSATTFSDPITLEGTYAIVNNSASLGTFNNPATNELVVSGAITGDTAIGGAYTLTLSGSNVSTNDVTGVISQGAGNEMALVKSGAGTWILSATNSYTGATTIDGGILGVAVLANAGANSSIGGGGGVTTTADIILNGGTLQHLNSTSGTSISTNRLVQVGDATGSGDTATFDNEDYFDGGYNGTGATVGAMNFTNTGAVTWGDTAVHTIILTGLNEANNTFALAIGDQGSLDPTGVGKSGIGTWVLTGANSYSGPTTITGGVLRDGTGTALPANSLLVLDGGTFETGVSTFTRTLGSAPGNIEITGGASGLSANGGAVSATINNSGNPLQFGTSTFNPSVLILNAPTALNGLTLNDSLDLNGATRSIATYANTATIDGSIINSAAGATAGLDKFGYGALVLNGTSSSTYNGTTVVTGGVLIANTAGSLGTGNATVWDGAELRLDNANALASTATVTLNNAILSENYNATQAGLAADLTSNSSGILAINGAQSNALNMAALGNGALYLGSTTGGAYSASSLGITSGGTELDSGGAPGGIATFGGYYLLGGGGSTLTITGQNVLTNQPASLLLNNYTGTTPSQSLLTSNNYNSLIVGDGVAAFGTVDLQNSQNYLGSTTINSGSTLELDYSNGAVFTSGNTYSSIISQYSPVTMNGGTLNMTAGAGTTDTQTLGGVTSNMGVNTISTTGSSTAGTNATLDLGALTTRNGAIAVFTETGTNTSITTTTGPDSSGATLGAPYLYDNAGAYTWAGVGAVSTSGTYTIGAYTGGANLSTGTNTSALSSTANYNMTGSTTFAQTGSQSMNLLRVTAASTLTVAGSGATPLTLAVNGILYTGTGSLAIDGATGNGSSLTSNSGNLYLYNEGTGSISFGSVNAISGAENLILSGGEFTSAFNDIQTAFTGATYLDGATILFASNTNFLPNTSAMVVNSGTTFEASLTSTVAQNDPLIMNGDFNLLTAAAGLSTDEWQFKGNNLLTNNITITVNTNDQGAWNLAGTLGDGGYGYGLTVGANSKNTQGTSINTPLYLDGTTTFTGPITVLGDSVEISLSTASNRFNVLNLAAGTTAYLQANGTSVAFSLAGLNDVGAPSSTELVANSNGGNNGSGTFLNLTLWGSGNYSFGGDIANYQVGDVDGETELIMDGVGTQTLTGTNSFNDGLTVNAGALIVDASKGGSIASQNLVLGGGTFEEIGASTGTTQTFDTTTATTVNAGQSKIVANSTYGTTTINLGALTLNAGGVLDIAPIGTSSTVTTTTADGTTGVLGQGSVVYTSPTTGVTTWAAAGTGVVATAISAYTGDTTTLVTTGGGATNYNIVGSQTQTGATTANLLRISNTATNTLNLGSSSLTLSSDGILYNGTAAYTITGGSIIGNGTVKQTIIENYAGAGGSLTIGSGIANSGATATNLVLAGTGTTYLTGTNTYTGITYLDGGTVNFNSSANFSGSSNLTFSGGTLQYATGNTYDLSNKTLTVNASGATIDTNGNAVTWAHNFGTGIGGMTFVDSYNAANPASATGVVNIEGTAGYTGETTIDNGGVVNLAGGVLGTASGTSGYTYVGSGGTLEGGLTQATSSSQGTSSDYAGKLVLQSGGVVAPGAPGIGTTVNNGTNGGIQNAGVGGVSGGNNAGDQNQDVGFNVLSATQLQWYAGGTLKFYLDDTTTASSATAPAASTVLNLGLGALAKMGGTGQYILNFANTGGYNGATGKPNVYDLINFGSSVNTSLDPNAYVTTNGNPNGNTNFNVDDFTIENLNGIGVLSFYYNANADNGAGQEELLLTVIPEPSTWAMLIGGLATLIFWTRRKRAAATRSLARK